MKKRIMLVIIICLAFVSGMVISAFGISGYSIKVGNDTAKMKYETFVKNGRIYVSVRDMCNVLGIPISWREDEKEAFIDIYNKQVPISRETERKDEGVIPDKETAYTVGKAILEKYAGKTLEYETEDKIFFLRVDFIDQYNAWRISQTFKFKNEGMGWAAGDGFYTPSVILNKKNGEVMSINTFSNFD